MESVVSAVAEQQAQLVAVPVAGIVVAEAAAAEVVVVVVAFEDIDNHLVPAPVLTSASAYVEREP